jgi:hypothetical protein
MRPRHVVAKPVRATVRLLPPATGYISEKTRVRASLNNPELPLMLPQVTSYDMSDVRGHVFDPAFI